MTANHGLHLARVGGHLPAHERHEIPADFVERSTGLFPIRPGPILDLLFGSRDGALHAAAEAVDQILFVLRLHLITSILLEPVPHELSAPASLHESLRAGNMAA